VTERWRGGYSDAIMDHCRNPRNREAMAEPDGAARGYNPHCGDEITVYLRLEGDRLAAVRFAGEACALATASASIMCGAVEGLSLRAAAAVTAAFLAFLEGGAPESLPADVRELGAARRYPGRARCAALPWLALRSAIEG